MKVITCFSYKGGAGRTVAAGNIAAALASMVRGVGSITEPLRRKVALVDLDVFSAGTHRVFDIDNSQVKTIDPCIQDYLRRQMAPSEYVQKGGIRLDHDYLADFRDKRMAAGNCHPEFTLFPARPDPDVRFVVQKQHENVLVELLMELEGKAHGFDYVVLDGESGTRQMADIALRLADIVLMFFRLTWQHIEGTLNNAEDFERRGAQVNKPFYLIPTCVPAVNGDESVYREGAPGLDGLIEGTERVPRASGLNTFADERPGGAGLFWAGPGKQGARMCIHDSLFLKGEERVVVFDPTARKDPAAEDFYKIAMEIDRRHAPSG